MQATVVDHVTPEMDLYAQESFGPVVAVIRVKGEEEAVRVANDTGYGLSAAIFSRDVPRAWKLALRVESGICHINGPTVHDEPQMPFGGVKASGYGRFGGKAAVNGVHCLALDHNTNWGSSLSVLIGKSRTESCLFSVDRRRSVAVVRLLR